MKNHIRKIVGAFLLFFAPIVSLQAQFGGGNYTISQSNTAYVGQTTVFTVSGPNILGTNSWSTSRGTVSSTSGLSTTVTWTSAGSTSVTVNVVDNWFNVYFTAKLLSVGTVLNAGTINGAQTICYSGNPTTLSNTASASGGSGGYTYEWQYSNNGSSGWTIISGATGTSYNPPGGLNASRWYRRKVTSGLTQKYSNTVKVTVRGNLSAGNINGTQTVCYAGDPSTLGNSTSPSGGTGIYAYQWQISTNNSSWGNVSGATSSTYNPPGNQTATRWYRRRVISCSQTKYTGSVKVTVLSTLTAGSIGGTQTVCYGGDPNTLGSSSSPSGGDGNYAYQWQLSSNNSSWSNVSGATSSTYNPPVNQTATRWYRRRVISCGQTKHTGSVKVTITGFVGVPSAPSMANNCGNTVLTRGTPPSGITWYWQSSASGTSTANSASSVTRTSGTVHYLRGRTSNGCWGTVRTVNYTVNNPTTYYADNDGDGQGNAAVSTSSCGQPVGYVSNSSDYDDGTVLITNLAPQTFYSDIDGDGFGDSNSTLYASFMPLGYATNNTDPCPNEAGNINGCPSIVSISPSDENYVHERSYQNETASSAIESITYFDGLGRPKQQVSIRASGTDGLSQNTASGWIMNWTLGSGGTPFFNQIGQTSENERINGPNPFGETDVIWQCGNDATSDADGGWNTDYFNVDKTKTYRYTVWVRRNHSQSGTTYHGTQNVDNLSGGANNNPYFWTGDLPQLGEWYLLVGIVHPYGYSSGDTGVSGVYDMQGNRVINGTEFKWGNGTTTSRFRSYLYYSTDVNVRQYFYAPVLEVVDGSETPLAAMFSAGEPKDLITHVDYDPFGRKSKEWLPMTASGDHGSFRTGDMAVATKSYYQNAYPDDFIGVNTADINAFSETKFEPSPMSRVLEQAAPGKDWRLNSGHVLAMSYKASTLNEVRRFKVNYTNGNTETPELTSGSTFYAQGELYKNITYDENHDGSASKDHTTETFTDKAGRVVLKRTYDGTAHDTYYVYDNFGQLTYVLPPKVVTSDGVSATELSELCYQYVYDHRNRLVEKKVPGKEWESIVYNKLDQPIMTQDPNQAAANEWLFTKYDAFGRVAYTGLINNSSSRVTLQNAASSNSYPSQYEVRSNGAALGGITVYYSNNTIPQSLAETLTVNYYDSYVDTNGLSVPATVYGVAKAGDVTGLPTVNKVRVLGTNDWTTTITGYDNRGRVIYTASKNDYLNTTDIVELKLDFTGRALETTTTHTKVGNAAIVTIDSYTYDHVGRLLKHEQTLGAHTEPIAENTYDELGQLVQKTVGGGLQTVDYEYNVRGWLKRINDPASLGNDLFAFGINYNTTQYGGAPLFNGNIAETAWRTSNDAVLRRYRYEYDALNRLNLAAFNLGDNSQPNRYSVSDINYDKNGNILSLKRQGHTALNISGLVSGYGVMDDLDYNYYPSSNQLQNVQELNGASTIYGFKNATTATTEYTYDDNGNMETDTNKGITAIGYNHLNLPTTVSMNGSGGTGTISYIYDATGVKLKKTVGSSVTDYAGNYMYQNGSLQFMNHPEGYVSPNGSGGYDYVYQYKDHLGNVRLSYADNNGTAEIIEESNYYPFGLKHKGYNFGGSTSLGNDLAQKWKFGGKEYQDELGLAWYDITARNYDPALGRWMNLDPLADQMRRHSPYNYAFDNPVFFVDPDGMAPMSYQDDIYLDRNGNEIYRVENDQPDRTFVVKTTRTTRQLYSGGTRDGNSNPISRSEARTTEGQISSGNLEGDHMNNVVQIANADTQQEMLDTVSPDDGGGDIVTEDTLADSNTNNFKEFSGNIDENGNVADTNVGSVTLPLPGIQQIDAGGQFDFHSHPSGQFQDNDGNIRNFTQPPSSNDIRVANGTEYVLGMRAQKVYIYNSTGVVAIIPFRNFGN